MKLDIDIVLLDESVVMHGFRALMKGGKLAEFKKNPVMLFMHNRPGPNAYAAAEDIILTIGRWYDIRIEGSQLLAKPDFDDDDDFAKKIQSKVEKGYYNAASVWIDPISVSDDPKLALPGQPGPTITEWGIFEASIVDIPNCRNALAIRNSAGKMLHLSASNHAEENDVLAYLQTLLVNQKNTDMDKKLLAAKLGLNENASDAELSDKLAVILDNAEKSTQLSAEMQGIKEENIRLKKEAEAAKIETLVDGAIRDLKLAAGDRDKFIKLAGADYATTKELIDGMKPYKPVESSLRVEGKDAPEFLKLSWDEIDRKNMLGLLREHPEAYKEKFKAKFGHEPGK